MTTKIFSLFLLAGIFFLPCVRAQECTPDFCSIPIEEVGIKPDSNVVALSHGFSEPREFAAFLREKAFGEEVSDRKGGGDRPWLLRLLFAFLAGLALNLSPCVLPMLPIQLAVLGMGARAKSSFDGFKRGAVYGSAIALTYGILGLVIIKTGAVFGQLQSMRAFNVAVGIIFLGLGLSLAGLFPIDFSRLGKRRRDNASILGLFLVGVTTALLAGACVAPAVIAVIIYGAELYAGGKISALALPFLLGLGMASPWPFIGAGLKVLPKPGRWIMVVKYGFAVLIVAMSVHYFRLAFQRDASYGEDYRNFDAVYGEALKEGKPIVIDFFASWCTSCSEMEKKTFPDKEVRELLDRCSFLRIQVEDPLEDDAVKLLARFGVRGFPAIVVLSGNGG